MKSMRQQAGRSASIYELAADKIAPSLAAGAERKRPLHGGIAQQM